MAQVPVEQEGSRTQVVIKEEGTNDQVHQRGATSALVAVDHGRDPAEAYMQATQTNDLNGMLQNWVQTTQDDRMGIIEEQLGYLEPEKVQGELETMNENLTGTISQGNYVETVKSMPSSIDKTEQEITKEAVLMQLRETLAEFAPRYEEMGVGEIASSIGGVMIPKRKEEALVDLMTSMGFVDDFKGKAGIWLDPTQEIMKLRAAF